MKRLAYKEITFKEFCEETYGYDPTTPEGEEEFVDLHQNELETIKKEYPGKAESFYVDKIINDLVVNEYYELANHRGFEPVMDSNAPSGGTILNDRRVPTRNKMIISIITDKD